MPKQLSEFNIFNKKCRIPQSIHNALILLVENCQISFIFVKRMAFPHMVR